MEIYPALLIINRFLLSLLKEWRHWLNKPWSPWFIVWQMFIYFSHREASLFYVIGWVIYNRTSFCRTPWFFINFRLCQHYTTVLQHMICKIKHSVDINDVFKLITVPRCCQASCPPVRLHNSLRKLKFVVHEPEHCCSFPYSGARETRVRCWLFLTLTHWSTWRYEYITTIFMFLWHCQCPVLRLGIVLSQFSFSKTDC